MQTPTLKQIHTTEPDLQQETMNDAPAAPTTEEVLALIRRDSQDKPRKYLDEVYVPNGGE